MRVGWAVASVVLVAACGSGGSGNRATDDSTVVTAHGTPAQQNALSPPGAELPNGFEVPPGSSLVGAALPDHAETGYTDLSWTHHWTAILFVQGEVVAVTNDLAAQAAAQGLPFDEDEFTGIGTGCREMTDQTPVNPPLSVTARPAGIKCIVTMATTDERAPGRPRRSLRISATQGECVCDGKLSPSIVLLDYAEFDDVTAGPPRPSPGWPETSIIPTDQTLALPAPGDELYLKSSNARIKLLEGSETLIPPTCTHCGAYVLLQRVDSPEILGEYRRETEQAAPLWDTAEWHEERDGWTVDGFQIGAGRTYIDFELFQRPGSPLYLRINVGES